jgi:hypothetical protein
MNTQQRWTIRQEVLRAGLALPPVNWEAVTNTPAAAGGSEQMTAEFDRNLRCFQRRQSN